MNYCTNCGVTISQKDSYCANCGRRIIDSEDNIRSNYDVYKNKLDAKTTESGIDEDISKPKKHKNVKAKRVKTSKLLRALLIVAIILISSSFYLYTAYIEDINGIWRAQDEALGYELIIDESEGEIIITKDMGGYNEK